MHGLCRTRDDSIERILNVPSGKNVRTTVLTRRSGAADADSKTPKYCRHASFAGRPCDELVCNRADKLIAIRPHPNAGLPIARQDRGAK